MPSIKNLLQVTELIIWPYKTGNQSVLLIDLCIYRHRLVR